MQEPWLSAENLFKSPKLKQHSHQLFTVLQHPWRHLTHPVPRTLERTGQTRVFRGHKTQSKGPLASCPLKHCEKNCTMIHLSPWYSICSCFLWAEMLLFPASLHPPISTEKPSYDGHTHFSHHRSHPGSPDAVTSLSRSELLSEDPGLILKLGVASVHRCTRWTAPVRNLSSETRKQFIF